VLACLIGAALIATHTIALKASAFSSSAQRKPSPNDCVLYVTVFTDKGVRLPDASFTVHAAGLKKPHWEGYSDARGEFAVRVVPPGDFEIQIRAKGYDTQKRTVTSESGEKLDLVFNMVPLPSKKP